MRLSAESRPKINPKTVPKAGTREIPRVHCKKEVYSVQISSRFTLAIHIFVCIHMFHENHKVTSDFLASSTNVNPVIVRKILGQLKTAGLVEVARGSGGASIPKPLNEISKYNFVLRSSQRMMLPMECFYFCVQASVKEISICGSLPLT